MHSFGHQQVAHAVGQIERVGNDVGDAGPFVVGWQRAGARTIRHCFIERFTNGGAGIKLPRRHQGHAIDDVARAHRFLRLVPEISSRCPPGVGQPQGPDVLAQDGVAQSALDAVAVQSGQRLIAPEPLQNRLRALGAPRIQLDIEGAMFVVGHEAAAQNCRARRLAERRRQQVAVAVRARIGFQVFDPGKAADMHAGRLLRAHLFEPPAGARGVPGVEPVGKGVERGAKSMVQVADGLPGKVIQAERDRADVARLRRQGFHRIEKPRCSQRGFAVFQRERLQRQLPGYMLAQCRIAGYRRN